MGYTTLCSLNVCYCPFYCCPGMCVFPATAGPHGIRFIAEEAWVEASHRSVCRPLIGRPRFGFSDTLPGSFAYVDSAFISVRLRVRSTTSVYRVRAVAFRVSRIHRVPKWIDTSQSLPPRRMPRTAPCERIYLLCPSL